MRARLAARQAAFAYLLGQYAAAHSRLTDCLSVAEKFDDLHETIFVLRLLGELEGWQGKVDEARLLLLRCLELCRAAGEQRLEAETLCRLAGLGGHVGDYAEGQRLAEASLEISRALNQPDLHAYGLSLLAWYTSCLGDYGAAATYWQRCLDIRRELDDQAGIATCLNYLGWVAWCEAGHQLAVAQDYLQQALAINRQLGFRLGLTMTYWKLSLVALEQGDYLQARRHGLEGYEIARDLESGIYRGVNMLGFGMALAGLGEAPAALVYLRDELVLAWRNSLLPNMVLLLYGMAWVTVRGQSRGLLPGEAAEVVGWLRAVVTHPAAWQPIKDRAARLLAHLETQFPDLEARAAHEKSASLPMAALPIADIVEAVVRKSAAPL
jgi:tetratricopeptide (TPR) repeat protein